MDMSGCSGGTPCPNCGKGADIYQDWKPFDYTSISCLHCGLVIYPIIDYMSLDDLNSQRKDNDMKPFKRLPKQEKDLW